MKPTQTHNCFGDSCTYLSLVTEFNCKIRPKTIIIKLGLNGCFQKPNPNKHSCYPFGFGSSWF
jgi:hypothetical protein